MHALLAHAYHLAQHGLHVLLLPLWRSPLAALAVTVAGRLGGLVRTRRGAALTACAAAGAGWLFLDGSWTLWPPPPVGRLPGLALILLAEAWLTGAARPRTSWRVTLPVAALAAWWLRGAPTGLAAVVGCLPVFLGLAAALPAARRLAHDDDGRGGAAAALALAAGIVLTGASAHWAYAALAPAAAAVVLLGAAGAAPALSGTVVMVAASTIVASDRGRLLPVDLACLTPLLVWSLAARLPIRRPETKERAFLSRWEKPSRQPPIR